MKNIEIKARAADLSAVRDRLAQRGLKLREIEGAEAQLIHYHRPDQAEAHASDYVISPVAEPCTVKEALARALGICAVVEKQRELYLWQHTRVHLDEVAGLGSFLELETVITDQSQEEAERECLEVQAALEIDAANLIVGSYAGLIAAHR